jgi:hypothetical protein
VQLSGVVVTETVGVTGRLTVGVLVGGSLVGLGDLVGTRLGSFVLGAAAVDGGAAGGGVILIGICVRGGEVRCGVGAGVGLGLFGGGNDGLVDAGGLIASGGSAPGDPGCSAMTAPPTVMLAAASASAIRL